MKTISLLFVVMIAAIVATGITTSIFTQEIDAGTAAFSGSHTTNGEFTTVDSHGAKSAPAR